MKRVGDWVAVSYDPVGQYVQFGNNPYDVLELDETRYIIQFKVPGCRWETCYMINKKATFIEAVEKWREISEARSVELRLLLNLDIKQMMGDGEYWCIFQIVQHRDYKRYQHPIPAPKLLD